MCGLWGSFPLMVGSIGRLWRYPVKSLLGEQREALDLNTRGVEGDRLFAIRNSEGKLASGKNTRRFFKLDGLFALRASYDGEVPLISFADGSTLRGDQPEIHATLSNTLGQPLTLAREADISHLDAGPVHLITTASLTWLQNSVPGVQADEHRFRPNIVVETSGVMPLENTWLGKTLAIGKQVVLRASQPTERCVMTTYAQSDLPFDPRILKGIAQHADLCFGIYAQVLVRGTIRCGDSVTVVD